MAPLPLKRYPDENHLFPFTNAGVDFFGPFYIQNKTDIEKHYGIIFTCFATRAVHFENCPNLNTDSLMNAVGRITARRGTPKTLTSDNGKTFVGASKELKDAIKMVDNRACSFKLQRQNIQWFFNPPYGPHFGGAWERLIQIAKRTIIIILGSRKLTLDVFQTILTETEMILNSRPLTIVTDYPENDEPLTPNHFLIQRPFSSLPPGVFDDSMPLTYTKWTHVQQMMNHLWKRLKKEYLPSLMKRPKWNEMQPPLKVGDIVWVLKDLTPRGIWPIGRVVEEHPGRDGTTRVVTVRTAYGTLNRPATALVKVF